MVLNKEELRKKISLLKSTYSEIEKEELSVAIFNKIEEEEVFKKAKYILCYFSMSDEVVTHDFINKWYEKKNILLPMVNGDELIIKPFDGVEKMEQVPPFGIYEPTTKEFKNLDKIDLTIVPGLAFDKNNNRLGRGKAFYDKLLPKLKSYNIGVGFDFQLVDEIETEDHDVMLDKIITND